MTLADLLPTAKDLEGIRGIERALLQRRAGSLVSFVLAVAVGVVQAALLLSHIVRLPNNPGQTASAVVSEALKGPDPYVFCTLLLFVAVYLIARYSGFLFQESKAPFQYTFCVQPFVRIKDTPDERFTLAQEDLLKLVHYDLRERLSRRIGRLSLLDHPSGAQNAGTAPSAVSVATHIHVEADYALREESDEGWVLKVLPRVRIGADANPFTLAFPVRYPLEVTQRRRPDSDPAATGDVDKKAQSALLRTDEYEQLIERVYSSVATEMYRQIKQDVENKIGLFPTPYLRAVARYYEARDFEKSNTLDSYERAIELYATARDTFARSKTHGLKVLLARSRVFRWLMPAVRAEARTRLGLARCKIYRRVVSELAGRRPDPLFEIRRELYRARALFARCYNSVVTADLRLPDETTEDGSPVVMESADVVKRRQKNALRANLTFPEDSAWNFGRRNLYLKLREELCEAYAVSALGYSRMSNRRRANTFLETAIELQPESDANAALVLLARSFVEGDLRKRTVYLRRARELSPEFEIVRYRLAVSLDMSARNLDKLTSERAQPLIEEYESVLRINPGNVASLVGQGYLFWLIGDLESAERVYRVAIDLQEIVAQTFVGDLKYSFARVAAEKAARCFGKFIAAPETSGDRTTLLADAVKQIDIAKSAYEEAVTAEPAVAAVSYSTSTRVLNAYYEYIGPRVVDRYAQIAQSLSAFRTSAEKLPARDRVTLSSDALDALETVLSYALNDYGNACLNFFLRFELTPEPNAEKTHLTKAISQWRKADEYKNVVAAYNLAIGLSWHRPGDPVEALTFLSKVRRQHPGWLDAIRYHSALNGENLRNLQNEVVELENRLATILEEIANLDGGATRHGSGAHRPVLARDSNGGYSGGVQSRTGEHQTLEPHLVRTENEIQVPLTKEEREKKCAALQKDRADTSDKLEKRKEHLALKVDRVFNELIADTRLVRLPDLREPKAIEKLLQDPNIKWNRYGDAEAVALASWAEALANMPNAAENSRASQLLCKHVLREYYPEDFDTLYVLLLGALRADGLAALSHLSDYEETWLSILEWGHKSDPVSTHYWYRHYSYYALYAEYGQTQLEDTESAIRFYQTACAKSDNNPFDCSNPVLYFESLGGTGEARVGVG